MEGGAAGKLISLVLSNSSAVNVAVFLRAVAVGSEGNGVETVLVNGEVVVHTVRVPAVSSDSGTALRGQDGFDHVGCGDSNVLNRIRAVAIVGQKQVVLRRGPVVSDRSGKEVRAALSCAGSYNADYDDRSEHCNNKSQANDFSCLKHFQFPPKKNFSIRIRTCFSKQLHYISRGETLPTTIM